MVGKSKPKDRLEKKAPSLSEEESGNSSRARESENQRDLICRVEEAPPARASLCGLDEALKPSTLHHA